MLPAQDLNAERLREQVRLAMTKREGARRVADGYAATGGAFAVADAFEALAAVRADSVRPAAAFGGAG